MAGTGPFRASGACVGTARAARCRRRLSPAAHHGGFAARRRLVSQRRQAGGGKSEDACRDRTRHVVAAELVGAVSGRTARRGHEHANRRRTRALTPRNFGDLMALNAQGFALLDLPPVTDEILGSYDDLPVDDYMGNGTRFKKFSQYRMTWHGSAWGFELLPHRDYTAYKKFNKAAGGIRRAYEPIKVDFTPMIAMGAMRFPLDVSDEWQINVHQNRTRASADADGPLTPEGIHHDGHDFVMIAVLRG